MQKILMLLGLIVLCACSLQADANTSETTIGLAPPELSAMCEQKGYTWNADSTCSYYEETELYWIKIDYPIELMPRALIESTIDSYIAEYRAFFMQMVETGDPSYPAAPWFFELKYTVYRHSSTIQSVQFTEYSFLGGPHHNILLSSFNFDLAANQILAFEDLFLEGVDVLAAIQPLARAELVETLNASGMAVPIDTNDIMVTSMTDELDDFRNFALTETDLLLSLGSHPVASHILEQGNVQIPLSDLEGILRDF